MTSPTALSAIGTPGNPLSALLGLGGSAAPGSAGAPTVAPNAPPPVPTSTALPTLASQGVQGAAAYQGQALASASKPNAKGGFTSTILGGLGSANSSPALTAKKTLVGQ